MLRPALVSVVLLAACRQDPDKPHDQHTGPVPQNLCDEEKVAPLPVYAQDIQDWITAITQSQNRYFGVLDWQVLEDMGEDNLGTSQTEIQQNRLVRGWDRIRFGDFAGAIHDLQAAEDIGGNPTAVNRSRELLGAAYMREAETVNCVAHGSGQSCIVPFGEHAIHLDPSMVESASAAFERALTDEPDQPSVIWIDNIAHMADGSFPDGVPAADQLPPGFLDSEEDFPLWKNVAPDLGITEATLSGDAAMDDFNGDGLLDILFSSIDPSSGMDLYINQGDGGFCMASNASGVSVSPGNLGFSVADYDNDGDLDILGTRAGWMGVDGTVRPSLLRNDGKGHFTDVAVEAGLDDPTINGPTQVGVWGDVNNDGWLDVFVGRESSKDLARVSSLYINQGDGTFVDVADTAGLRGAGFVKGAAWLDFDGDGDLDLYVSDYQADNKLYVNNGDMTFTNKANQFGMVEPFRSFAVAPLDYDQDGRQDIFVSAFSTGYGGGGPLDKTYFRSSEAWFLDRAGEPPPLDLPSEYPHIYHNTPDGWVDVSVDVGIDDVHATMGLSFGDIDADGYPDIMQATGAPEYDALEPKAMYHNVGGTHFNDVTMSIGMGSIQKGHGVAFGDIDEDGDEDMLLELGGAYLSDVSPKQVFVNPTNDSTHTNRHTVTLRLEGVTVNREAIGARVRVVTPTHSIWKWEGETGSFGNNSSQLEFGLGDDDTIDRIEIDWPAADTETVEDVPVDSVVSIREGEGIVDSRPLAPWALRGAETDER